MILERIAAGGMGLIYKARHKVTGKVVALKLVNPAAMDSPETLQRFQREVKAVTKLNHPNLVPAIDAAVTEGVWYLAMEYIDGKDFKTLVNQTGRLAVGTAVNYIVQAAQGLHYVHCLGIIHRDIKPSNLMLEYGGTVRVLDLGLARFQTDSQCSMYASERLTQPGQMLGTAGYVAPEQIYDPHAADLRSDIYSLGCTLFYLITGEAPYGDQTLKALMGHQEGAIPSMREFRTDVTPSLDGIVHWMLAKNPLGRPNSLREVVQELEPYLPVEASHYAQGMPPLPDDLKDRYRTIVFEDGPSANTIDF
jgi:serine/threonine protein kinase